MSFAQIDLKLQSWEIGSDHGERLVMKDVCKNYYKQALQIKIDFNDRFSLASTYHQLGIVAQQQRQWEQARQYLLETLKISAEFSDQHVLSITLRTLARLWEHSGDKNLPAATAPILSSTPEEATELLRGLLD